MQPFILITNALFSGRRRYFGQLCGWLLAGLLLGPQLPAQPVLVKDINRKSTVAPEDLTDVNGTLFFTVLQEPDRRALWKSDGTPGGTVRVKDIYPDAETSQVANLVPVNGTLFLAVYTGNGVELCNSTSRPCGRACTFCGCRPGRAASSSGSSSSDGRGSFPAGKGTVAMKG